MAESSWNAWLSNLENLKMWQKKLKERFRFTNPSLPPLFLTVILRLFVQHLSIFSLIQVRNIFFLLIMMTPFPSAALPKWEGKFD